MSMLNITKNNTKLLKQLKLLVCIFGEVLVVWAKGDEGEILWFLLGGWFVVDCFHWQGHVGCPLGYCLDTYKHMSLREINSQVNEQANAGLQRIREQLAYMTSQNFMFTITLFISVKSMDIQRKLDVSSIRI